MNCVRCRQACTRIADLVTITKEVPAMDQEFVLCRDCTRALEDWLNPPEAVREGWASRRLGQGT